MGRSVLSIHPGRSHRRAECGDSGRAKSGKPTDFATEIESELLYFRKHFGVTGVLTAVLLTNLADSIRAWSGLIRHRDRTRAAAAIQRSWTTIQRLVLTGLASRATL